MATAPCPICSAQIEERYAASHRLVEHPTHAERGRTHPTIPDPSKDFGSEIREFGFAEQYGRARGVLPPAGYAPSRVGTWLGLAVVALVAALVIAGLAGVVAWIWRMAWGA